MSQQVQDLARELYYQSINNHETIHCNRFAVWDELEEKERVFWMQRANLRLHPIDPFTQYFHEANTC